MSTDAVRRAALGPALLVLLAALPAAAVEVAPVVELGAQYNGNPNVTGEDAESESGLQATLTLPFLWESRRASTRLSYRLNGDIYRSEDGENSDSNDLSHALAASYNRTLSRRSSLGFRLGASRSEQQGVLLDNLAEEPGVPLPSPSGYVPRTTVGRANLGINGRVGTGERSFLTWGMGGARDIYDDPPGVDLVDSSEYGVSGGWGLDVAEGASVSVGAEARRIDPQDTSAIDVLTLSVGGQRRLGRTATGALEIGASRAEGEEGDTRTEPRFSGSLTWPLPPNASLALSAQQSIGGSNGILRSASLRRDVSFGWRYSPPRGWTAGVTLAWRQSEALAEGVDEGGTESIETRESLGWTPGGRFTYGIAHSWRKQDALDAAAEPFATDYHAFEAFVRWMPFGRRERPEGAGAGGGA